MPLKGQTVEELEKVQNVWRTWNFGWCLLPFVYCFPSFHYAAIFSVMSYNVLCEKYATKQLYGYCPTWALAWEYRRKGIMDEILHANADIICLQEVETDQFFTFFYPTLKQHGYEGVFSPKSRAKTMSEHERKYVDGCAIFFRVNKWVKITFPFGLLL